MSQQQLFPARYNNRSLFSDYYLEELAVEDSHWRTLKSEAPDYRQRISDILKKALPGIDGNTPEAEVERRLIRPILDTLGHDYFVQPAVPSSEGVKRPDYAFFPSEEARQQAESHKGELEFFKTALAVGDAKAWQRSLDKRNRGPGDPFTNHNPSYQIDFYLRATERKWGLLTNGRHWRLYHRDVSYRLDVYYEVDLPHVITLDKEAFLCFLIFFHKQAFEPDGTGECFLDRAYRASTEYATRVSEELKDNVYEALRLLAEGFLCLPANGLKASDLDGVRENAFIVIYRLLFILYAEAREFLPVSNPTYFGTYSLRALTREIAAKEPFEANLHPMATGYWSRLQGLFGLVNNGDDFLHIPPYNGRLFDDQKEHQSLATWEIGDRYLAATIDQLARARAAGRTGRGFVSYRDLSIRELGSIYEGLLEHRPRQATEDMAVVRDEKRERFVPLADLAGRRVLKTYRAGSVYLETDKGERKSTGSYYTPDYIVKYIVSNTLGPLLEEAKKSNGNLIDAILGLKVLDPAMGSGHFLVEATDCLARALVEALGGDPREMEEDEIRWARREVVERCIYGVDLNPLAVDLAKLSLWLSTVSLDKPLNFLNHHLRCGNSLIGARLEDLGQIFVLGKKKAPKAAPASQGLLEYYFHQNVATAVDNYFRIAAISSDKLQDIKEKEGLYGIARDILKRYREVAHVWTSSYFGNGVPADGYMDLQDKIRATDADWTDLERQPWFAKGVELAVQCRFFHWELEFPEVFFDRNGQRLHNPGFSAAVGNPPWLGIRTGELEGIVLNWLRARFKIAIGQLDLAAIFLELGSYLASERGIVGMVVPKRIGTNEAYEVLRQELVVHRKLLAAVDLGVAFEGVNNDALVVVSGPLTLQPSTTMIGKRFHDEEIKVSLMDEQMVKVLPFTIIPVNSTAAEVSLAVKMSGGFATTFGGVAEITRGAECGMNHPAISRNATPGAIPILDHLDVDRYYVRHPEWYLDPSLISTDVLKPMPLYRTVPKLLVRFLSPTLVVGIDEAGFASTNLLYHIKCSGDPNFFCALLSSSLMNLWYRTAFQNEEVKFPHVQKSHLERIPVRRINFATPEVDRGRLGEECNRLYHEFLNSRDWDKLLRLVGQCLAQKPDGTPDTEREQSDVIHDLAAFLAGEMTRLHKEKQAEIKGFLRWMESYLGIAVDDLKNKTKVKEYWKAEVGWEGVFSALEQNRRAVQSAKGIDVTRRDPQETIRAEFEASLAKLKPVLERIGLTDKLIDQIVYKLYGLTEEEIAVVEGNCRRPSGSD